MENLDIIDGEQEPKKGQEELEETTTSASSGQYSTPFFLDPKNGKGKKPFYKGGAIVEPNREKHTQGVNAFKLKQISESVEEFKKALASNTLSKMAHLYGKAEDKTEFDKLLDSNPVLKQRVKNDSKKMENNKKITVAELNESIKGELNKINECDCQHAEEPAMSPIEADIMEAQGDNETELDLYQFEKELSKARPHFIKNWVGTSMMSSAVAYDITMVNGDVFKLRYTDPNQRLSGDNHWVITMGNGESLQDQTTAEVLQALGLNGENGGEQDLDEGMEYQINDPEYLFYVCWNDNGTLKITEGFEYDSDAKERKAELRHEGDPQQYFIYSKRYLKSKGINVDDNSNWAEYKWHTDAMAKKDEAPIVMPEAAPEMMDEEEVQGNLVNSENLTEYIVKYQNEEADDEECVELFAYLIKTGMAWKLSGYKTDGDGEQSLSHGSFGRTANKLIDDGIISKDGTINWEALEGNEEDLHEEEVEAIAELQESIIPVAKSQVDRINKENAVISKAELEAMTKDVLNSVEPNNSDDKLEAPVERDVTQIQSDDISKEVAMNRGDNLLNLKYDIEPSKDFQDKVASQVNPQNEPTNIENQYGEKLEVGVVGNIEDTKDSKVGQDMLDLAKEKQKPLKENEECAADDDTEGEEVVEEGTSMAISQVKAKDNKDADNTIIKENADMVITNKEQQLINEEIKRMFTLASHNPAARLNTKGNKIDNSVFKPKK